MKVTMPVIKLHINFKPEENTCVPFLCRNKADGEVETAIATPYGITYFEGEGSSVPVTYSTIEWFNENMEFIRMYAKGETLSITV